MGIIYVAHGRTGAGKTEVANYLQSQYGAYHFHPIGFMKRFEEKLCGLPEGSLDLPLGKSAPVPGNESKSMQQYMIALYHFYKEWMPGRSTLNMRRELPELLEKGDVCVVSLRNLEEVNSLVDIRDAGNHRMIAFNIHREVPEDVSSDENYIAIRDLLWKHANMMFPLNNNFSLGYLHMILDDIIRYCK